MDYKKIARKIIDLMEADLALREKLIQAGQLGEGYNEEMKLLHNNNAKSLNDIVDIIGYPTVDKVGKAASEAAWLVIQHSIGQPDFMRKCAALLKDAVKENKANPQNLAYLSDRIALLEGKQQLYGTQFDWDEHGELSANAIDDVLKVNERRRSVGMNTLEEQTRVMRERAKRERQYPPPDLKKRKDEMNEWRAAVGWK